MRAQNKQWKGNILAGSVNKVILVGNLARDPEVRATNAGGKIVNLTLATSESWKDRDSGEKKERAEFHRVTIFNERLADVAERFLKKGRKIYLEGQLETRKYTDKEGVEKYTTEVVLRNFRGELVLLDSNRSEGDAPAEGPSISPAARSSAAYQPSSSSQSTVRKPGGGSIEEDEIPFGAEVR